VRRAAALLLGLALLGGAAAAQEAPPPPAPSGAQAALLEADLALAEAILADGPRAAYAAALAADGILFDAAGPSQPGPAAAEQRFAGFPPDARMQRSPEAAAVSADGASGTSWGGYALSEGARLVVQGRYLTSWRREDGVWRIVAELAAGRTPRPPAPAQP
jgi:hypothetical protein